jgi:fatty-acyl-CoA synthase
VSGVQPDALLWPVLAGPADLAAVEAVPLEDRGVPGTTYAALSRAASLWPARTAMFVLPDAERWQEPVRRTYAQLLADVHRAANLLQRLGVRRGDPVALLSPNCDELLTGLLAAQVAGIAQPVNSALSSRHVTELIRRSGARVLLTAGPELDPAAWHTAGELAGAGLLDAVLVLAPTAGTTSPPADLHGVPAVSLAAAAADQNADVFVGQPPTPDDLASLFHTGGTTGLPKLAAHTHRNEVSDAWMLAANRSLTDDDVIFAGLPLFHVNALVVTLLAALLRGQPVVWAGPLGYREPALFAAFWAMVEHYRIATMSAVPTVYARLSTLPVDADVSSLRLAMVGASPLPPAVRDGFEQHTGVPLIEGYGLTEATCATARCFPDFPAPGSVGQRLPYQQVKAVAVGADGSWTDLPPGTVGNLVIAGPTVFPGYVVGRDEAGLRLDGLGALRDGWLDTGDLAAVDADGFIRLAGRAKDLIIRGGHNIDPRSVEDALLSHPDVTGAGAVGRPDEHAGEVPVAYVTVVPGSTADGDALRGWATQHVAEAAASPKAVTVLDALPQTAVGKLYKLPLRALAAADAVRVALAGHQGVLGVDGAVENGAVVVIVHTTDAAAAAVEAVLGRFALPTRVQVRA